MIQRSFFGIIQYFHVTCLFLQYEMRRIADPQKCGAKMTPDSVKIGNDVIQTFDKQLN